MKIPACLLVATLVITTAIRIHAEDATDPTALGPFGIGSCHIHNRSVKDGERCFATRLAAIGAKDTIDGASGTDVIFGGAGKDKITANLGGKIIFGDHGEANLGGTSAGATNDVFSADPGLGDDDEIIGGADGLGNIIIGGAGNDDISGGTGDDIILGDNGVVERNNASVVTRVYTIEPTIGGTDTVEGGSGFDIIMGGAKSDTINAPLGGKVILGDSGVANFLADPEARR